MVEVLQIGSGPVGIWIKIHLNPKTRISPFVILEVSHVQRSLREKPSKFRYNYADPSEFDLHFDPRCDLDTLFISLIC